MEDASNNSVIPETSPVAPTEVATISYKDRLKSILEAPDFSDEIFNHVANGGDLITLCHMKDIRYSDFALWSWRNPEIGKMLSKACDAQREWVRMRVLGELRHIALVDLRLAFNSDGSLKDPKDWPESVARALSSVETDELYGLDDETGKRKRIGETKKIKLNGKIDALKLIGQEFGLFVQKHQVEVVKSLEDLVSGSWTETEDNKKINAEGKSNETSSIKAVEAVVVQRSEHQGAEAISDGDGDAAEPS